jgi:hypothetical protein
LRQQLKVLDVGRSKVVGVDGDGECREVEADETTRGDEEKKYTIRRRKDGSCLYVFLVE